MPSELHIANVILAWVHSVRGESAATRYLESEFGASLATPGITSSMLPDALAAASVNVDAGIESREDFKKFLASVTSKGYFKGVDEGTADYSARYSKLLEKFRGMSPATSAAATAAAPASEPKIASSNDEAAAENAKLAGNKAVEAGQHRRAVELYTDAIAFAPTGKNVHVYYSNRAAARLSMKEFKEAAEDARLAIAADASYAKGWSRLGGALLELEEFTEAVEAYEKCVSLDPTNKLAKDGLSDAKSRLRLATKIANAPPRAAAPANENPLAGMMAGLGGAAGGGRGMPPVPPGLQGKMAELMSDPDMIAALADPELAPIMAGMMKDGPMSIMQHIGNPKVMGLASKLMGKMGMGGMGGM
jgi:small glutamine-rich tetratricopeptide repeat-containing protein alpha